MKASRVITPLTLFTVLALSDMARADAGASETRSVGTFKAIDVAGTLEVEVVIGKTAKVEVKGTANELKRVTTTVKNGVLVIGTDMKGAPRSVDLEVQITVPALDAITLSGTAEVDVKGLAASAFTATVSGTGELELAGKATALTLNIPGTAQIEATGLQATSATVDIAGTGNVELSVSDKLAVAIAGTGNVEAKGNPKVTKKITGTGNVDTDG
jgi:hypothetical protein